MVKSPEFYLRCRAILGAKSDDWWAAMAKACFPNPDPKWPLPGIDDVIAKIIATNLVEYVGSRTKVWIDPKGIWTIAI